jgi:RNA polymerase sigma-70 factor (ECF subfamily)
VAFAAMMDVREEMMQHVPRLRRYARALLKDHDLADDLVQDTLERGLRNTARFRPGSDLRAWLSTIMHHVFVNQISKLAAHAVHVQMEDESIPEGELAIHGNQSQSLEVRDIDEALQRLPAEQREVVLLVALEEMSYAEIAVALEVPIGTVMSRLSRARERLRELMPEVKSCAKRKVV